MATTRIMPLHTGKGQNVGTAISDVMLFPLDTTAVMMFVFMGSPPIKRFLIGDRGNSLPIQLA